MLLRQCGANPPEVLSERPANPVQIDCICNVSSDGVYAGIHRQEWENQNVKTHFVFAAGTMVALAGALFAQNREREQVRPRGSVPVFLLGKLRYGTRALGGDSAVR